MTITGKGAYKEGDVATFTITQAPLTVTADDQSRTYGEENPEFAFAYSGWKGTDDEGTLTTLPTATCEATAASPVGDYDIAVGGGEARNYYFNYVGGTLTIAPKTIVAEMISLAQDSYEYAAEDITPEVTVMDGERALSAAEDYDVAYADNRDAGTATVTVTGKGNYDEGEAVTFAITQAPLTVTADDQRREQGQENPELTFAYSGWKGTDDESVLTTLPTASTTASADSPAGDYDITVGGGEARNYYFNYVDGTLTITLPSGIAVTTTDGVDGKATWHTLGGQRLGQRPTAPGIYIQDGRKVVVK